MRQDNGIQSLKVVDLFAGAGGLSIGFEQAGFNVVASFDCWDVAIRHGQKNLKHPVIQCDLGDVRSALEKIRCFSPDIIIGGPPCQDFSSAGKRDESGGRANLTLSFAEIVKALKPKYFVMENVDRAGKSRTMEQAKQIFRGDGYGLTVQVLDASLCGVPQVRKRLFIVGVKNGAEDQLAPYLLGRLAPKKMTIREYFGRKINVSYYYRHPRSYKRRAIFSVDEPSPTIRGVNRPVPAGYPGHPGDPIKINASIRPLSSTERARVQTFPEDYIFDGAKSDIEQLIGNAVPVNLAKYVADSLRQYVESGAPTALPQFFLFEKPPSGHAKSEPTSKSMRKFKYIQKPKKIANTTKAATRQRGK